MSNNQILNILKISQSNRTVLDALTRAVIFILAVFVVTVLDCQAQTKAQKKKLYLTWIEQKGGLKINGVLYQVKDSSVVISNSRNPQEYKYAANKLNYLDVPANQVQEVKLRKDRKVGSSILIGIAGGFLVGMTRGLIEGETIKKSCGSFFGGNCSEEVQSGLEKGLSYGAGYGIIGGVVGGVIGSIKIKIPINGNKDWLKTNRAQLRKYAYMGGL